MYLILWAIVCVLSVCALPIKYDLEHCYIDGIPGTVGLLAKPKTKGPDISQSDGKPGTLHYPTKSPWYPSLDGQRVFLEYTSGWVILWRDAEHRQPLLPSEEDYRKSVTDGSVGYLKGLYCGWLEV